MYLMIESFFLNLSETYNKKRHSLPFATIDAGPMVIKYLFIKYPEYNNLSEDEQIERIGKFINDISFN